MPRPPARYPTDLELDILKILWREGTLATSTVRERLAKEAGRDLAPTSVITTLNVMTDKGYLTRKRDGKRCLFRARVRENTISKGMVGDLVERVFDGSARAMMLNLVEHQKLTPDDLSELENLVKQLKKQPGDASGSHMEGGH